MIAVRDPTEVSRNRSFEILDAALMRHVPGFELAILQMQQPSADCIQAVTSADGRPTPSGIATPRLSGS